MSNWGQNENLYDSWVDNLINTHQQRLNELKTNKETRQRPLRNYANTITDTQLNDKYKSFRDNKMQNMLETYMQENAELKLKLKELEEKNRNLTGWRENARNDFNENNEMLYEREKDLLETVKLLNIDNKRLQEKVTELTQKPEMLDSKSFSQLNCVNMESLFRKERDDLQLTNKKLEKVINLFLSFIDKNFSYADVADLNKYIQNFDFELLNSKFKDLNGILDLKNQTQHKIRDDNKMQGKEENEHEFYNTKNRDESYNLLNERLEALEKSFNNIVQEKNYKSSNSKVSAKTPSKVKIPLGKTSFKKKV